MSRSDRVAFVTVSREDGGARDAQSDLDAEAIRERLGQGDAGFEIVGVDARDDIAGQIDDDLSARRGPLAAALFYASCEAISEEGELLLRLDPSKPDTVDALSDILGALMEPTLRTEGPQTLALLDLRAQSSDPLELASLADHARTAARRSQVELVVAVRPSEEVGGAPGSCSPLTRAVLERLDDVEPEEGLFVAELVEPAFEAARALGRAGALAHASAAESFEIVVAEDVTARVPEVASPPPAAADEEAPAPFGEGEVRRTTEGDLDWDGDAPPRSTMPSGPPEPMPAPTSAPPASVPPASIPPARPSVPPPNAADALAEATALESAGKDEEAVAKLRKALSLVGTSVPPLAAEAERARVHLRIADVMLRLGRGREAIAGYEKALSLGPDIAGSERALRQLLTLYLGEGDRRAISSVEERLGARLAPESPERVDFLVTFGRAWMVELGDPLRARERLEHARALAPQNREVVRLLLQLAEKEQRTEDADELRRTYAELDPDPKTRARALAALGRDLLAKKREDLGLDLLDAALDADPSALEPLETLSQLLGERQEWGELEAAYRRMLDRAARVGDPDLATLMVHELQKRLGHLLVQHLEDDEGALAAFSAASAARPEEPTARRSAIEIAQRLGRSEVIERNAAALVALDPRDEGAYRALFDVFVRTERIERAVDAGKVLAQLGAAQDRERVLVSAHRDDDAGKNPQAALAPEDWRALRAPLDPAAAASVELVANVFRAGGAALVKAFTALAARAGRLAPLDESLRVDPETSTVSAVRAISWASKVLGLDRPAIYAEDSSSEGMRVVLREAPVVVVGASALRGRAVEELRFLSGYVLAGQVPEHRIVRLVQTLDDLAACFLAGVVIAVPDTPVPERVRSLVELLVPSFASYLEAHEETALEEAVIAFDAGGGRADLVAFQRAVERAGLRAGWLLARELEPSIAAAQSIGGSALSRHDREGEILAFTVTDPAFAMRSALYP